MHQAIYDTISWSHCGFGYDSGRNQMSSFPSHKETCSRWESGPCHIGCANLIACCDIEGVDFVEKPGLLLPVCVWFPVCWCLCGGSNRNLEGLSLTDNGETRTSAVELETIWYIYICEAWGLHANLNNKHVGTAVETTKPALKEFKWADFFGRQISQQPLCLMGVATLLLDLKLILLLGVTWCVTDRGEYVLVMMMMMIMMMRMVICCFCHRYCHC